MKSTILRRYIGDKKTLQHVLFLLNSGKSVSQVAKDLNICPPSLYRMLEYANVRKVVKYEVIE